MPTYSLLPGPELEASLKSLAYLHLTENFFDFITQMGWIPIDTSKITDAPVRSELDRLNTLCHKNLDCAVKHAKKWSSADGQQDAIKDQVANCGTGLADLAEQWAAIIQSYTAGNSGMNGKEFLDVLSEELSSLTTSWASLRPAIDRFSIELDQDLQAFANEYQQAKAASKHVTDLYHQLESDIQELQKSLDKTNDDITQKVISTSISDAKAGIMALMNAADENYVGAVRQLVTMYATSLKTGIEGIILEEKAIDLLHQIIAKTNELHIVEVGLMRLGDLEAQLQTINQLKNRVSRLADVGGASLQQLTQQLNAMKAGQASTPADWSVVQKSWSDLKTQIDNFLDVKVDKQMPVLDAGKTKLVSAAAALA